MPKQIYNPGKLRQRLEVQKAIKKTDATGAPYVDYEKGFDVWGDITPNNGQGVFRSEKYSSVVDGLIEVRFRSDITAEHRIKTKPDERILEIESLFDPTGEKRRLHLLYKEVL